MRNFIPLKSLGALISSLNQPSGWTFIGMWKSETTFSFSLPWTSFS